MERHYEITDSETIVKNIFNEEDIKMFDHLLHKMLGFSDDIELDDNLKETPKRYLKLWTEMTSGYREDPKKYLQKCFPVNSPNLADDSEVFDEEATDAIYRNGIVMVSTDAWSNCCHHLAPMHGRIYVAYIPNKKVVGLSKIVRAVKAYGKRLNLQEQWMANIADAMMEVLEPLGVVVAGVGFTHSCVSMRGASEQTSATDTIAVRGIFTENPNAKAEVLSMIANAEAHRN
nr:MAG TPA: GTP cyclohydrolase I [Bacteriophage sp.]